MQWDSRRIKQLYQANPKDVPPIIILIIDNSLLFINTQVNKENKAFPNRLYPNRLSQ